MMLQIITSSITTTYGSAVAMVKILHTLRGNTVLSGLLYQNFSLWLFIQ